MSPKARRQLARASNMILDACNILRSQKGADAEAIAAAVMQWSQNGLPMTREVELFAGEVRELSIQS